MRQGLTSIPFRINISFWILAVLIGWINSSSVEGVLLWVVVVFLSVLIHEFGHAITAILYGQRVAIELGAFGGATTRHGPRMGRGKEFLVVLMGPLFGLIVAAFSYFALFYVRSSQLLTAFFEIALWANVFWTVINLLPVHPLDGGKLMAITLEALFGPWGTRFSFLLSGLFAILCTIFFLTLNSIIAAALFLLCAFESFRSWQNARQFVTENDEDKFYEELKSCEHAWHSNQREDAIRRLETLCQTEKRGKAFFQALEMLCDYLLMTGHAQKAYDLLIPHKNELFGESLRDFQLAAFQLGKWDESLIAGQAAFLEKREVSCALLNAFSSAHLLHAQEAINWLTSAKMAESIDMEKILASDDLDPIRSDPLFQSFKTACRPLNA